MKYATLVLSVAVVLACSLLAHPGFAMAAENADRERAEQHRIDLLLDAIGKQNDLVFIRNGSGHTADEALNHLKRKLRSAGSKISTAEEFIDHLATGSSLSGKPYLIQQPGHEPEPAGTFLHRLLLEVSQPS